MSEQQETPLHIKVLQYLEKYAKSHPDAIAFRRADNESDVVTFQQAHDATLRIASYLHANGYGKGHVLCMVWPNCWQFSATSLAGLSTGMTVTGSNDMHTSYEHEHLFKLYECDVIFVVEQCLEAVLEAKERACPHARVICLKTDVSSQLPENIISFDEATRHPIMFDPFMEFDIHNDMALLPTSSGTTGPKKGIELPHRSLVSMLWDTETMKGLESFGLHDRPIGTIADLVILPQCFYMAGFLQSMTSLYRGRTVMFLKDHTPENIFSAIEKYKIPILVAYPTIAKVLCESPIIKNYDLSSWKWKLSLGCTLPLPLVERYRETLGIRINSGYGMTEFGGASHSFYPFPPSSSIGKPLPAAHVKVIDPDTGKVCGPNERGELRIKHKYVMKGYKNDPEKTRDSFDDEGYYYTGDLGYFDNEGFYYITGRIKDLMKCHGKNVNAAEIEDCVLEVDGVLECAVIGIPHKDLVEVAAAVVVVSKKIDADIIYNHVAEHLSPHKHLTGGIYFADSIPKSPTGKILHRQLREQYAPIADAY